MARILQLDFDFPSPEMLHTNNLFALAVPGFHLTYLLNSGDVAQSGHAGTSRSSFGKRENLKINHQLASSHPGSFEFFPVKWLNLRQSEWDQKTKT